MLSLPIIIVGTKTDILAHKEPNNHMKTCQAFAWGYNMIYVPVDNISGEGIDKLVRRIVDIVSALDIVRCIKQNIEKLVALVLDGIAWCFKLPLPEPIVKHNLDLTSLTNNAEISNLVSQPTAQEWDHQLSQRLNTEPSFIAPISTHLITPSLIAKRPLLSEVAAIEYVWQNTSIPTPHIHLSTELWLVMDHIDGTMYFPFDDYKMDWSLVFKQSNLNPSNIMLAKDSSLWLIDWGFAGFYPAFFETIAMKVVDELLYNVNPES
uniref:Protein kinase domain-containing protein n=1 Tax=Moniliophthora roreri TaxID=221103 RepID=A0A0W0GAR4_MONRR